MHGAGYMKHAFFIQQCDVTNIHTTGDTVPIFRAGNKQGGGGGICRGCIVVYYRN
jgi:hypothetical protein